MKKNKNYSEFLNQTICLIPWKTIFLPHLNLAIIMLMILLIVLMLKLVVEIPIAMLLNLLMFSPKVKKMKVC